MASNAAVTNTFSNGTTADAPAVNQNFTDVVTWINTNAVHLDGSKAFTSVPSGPATNPTSANQLTRKAYVDSFFPVTQANLGTNSVAEIKIVDGAVTINKLGPNSVDRSKLTTALMPRLSVANSTARAALTGLVTGQEIYQADINATLVYNGVGWSMANVAVASSSTNDFTINSGVVVGVAGVKNMSWTFVGGVAGGLLRCDFLITLGSSGFSVSAQPNIDFPTLAGWTFTAAGNFDSNSEIGPARLQDVAGSPASYRGIVKRVSGTSFVVSTDIGTGTLSGAVPFTWAAGDQIMGSFCVRGTMTV